MKTYGLSWIALFLTSCLAHSVNLNSGQTPTGLSTPKIDTHSHVYPDFYRDAVIAAGQVPGPDGNAAPPVSRAFSHLQRNTLTVDHMSLVLSIWLRNTSIAPVPG